MKSFDQLFIEQNWRPIRDCPGRYVLRGARYDLSPADVLGEEIRLSEHNVPAARDTVLVARLNGGGLISYRRADRSFLHTLNTPEGFERKLLQLGIVLEDD
jgi:hypothetical protein